MEFHESKKLQADGQKVALVDVDETVCTQPGERKYDQAVPIQEAIDKVNALYDKGWYIIYWTARGGSEASKRAGRCYWDFTNEQLLGWGCKFHELSTGSKGNYKKPPNDIIIDDKAIDIKDVHPDL